MSRRVTNGNQTCTAPTVYSAHGAWGQAWFSLHPFSLVCPVDTPGYRVVFEWRTRPDCVSSLYGANVSGLKFPDIDAALAWLLEGEDRADN